MNDVLSPAGTPRPSPSRTRWFKRLMILLTLGAVAGTIAAFPVGRFYAVEGYRAVRTTVIRKLTGLEPDREEIEADWVRRRRHSIAGTMEATRHFYDNADDAMQRLFQVAGMDPEHALVVHGRADQSFLVSSKVFERDEHGRSFRLRPNTRSVWLRRITLLEGPFGLFQVLDDAAHREAADNAGAVVDEPSITTTNSWGLRGPEPDPSAPLRGLVLGDSFMQGMFNGDEQTPPYYLGKQLSALYDVPVSILNTGHIGYSPEQYYYTLMEYGERMDPHFVVVSVCPNDFGNEFKILEGDADWLAEAGYWLDKIYTWCRSRGKLFLLVPVPTYPQVENRRRDGYYPGLVNNIFTGPSTAYGDPLETFIDAHLDHRREAAALGQSLARSVLYNRHIDDDHFSPTGAALWAEFVARRLMLLLETTGRAYMPSLPHPKVSDRSS